MSYLIAVTTSDGQHVDLHFGHASRFLIIEVVEETGTWIDRGFRSLSEEEAPSDDETGEGSPQHDLVRFERIASLLEGTSYLLTQRIGPKPHRILLQRGISALETPFELDRSIALLNAYHVKNDIRC